MIQPANNLVHARSSNEFGPTPSRPRATVPTEERVGRILVVDDEDGPRRILDRALRSFGHQTVLAKNGAEALAKLQRDIDLVMLDGNMPGLDGFTVARRIREQHLDLPIIMVTGLDTREDRLRAVEAGVNDFVGKPFDLTEIKLRSQWLLRFKQASDELKNQRAELERMVEKRTEALRQALEETAAARRATLAAHLDTIRRLVIAAEYKDHDTARHIERIGRFSEIIAEGLSLPPERIDIIRHATPMHDVGKIGIPDGILRKAGRLSHKDWEIMKRHTTIGARILQGSPSEVIQNGERVALTHHERFDGSGYPHGLAGEEIPLDGRICAVADVFDALTSPRHYRVALPNDVVCQQMNEQKGKHFDPAVLDVFLDHFDHIESVQRELAEVPNRPPGG